MPLCSCFYRVLDGFEAIVNSINYLSGVLLFTLSLLSCLFIGHTYSSWNLKGYRKQNKITTKIWKWKPQKNTNMFTHKTTSYFKAIVKGNDLINSKTIDWIWAIYVTPWSPKTIKLTRSEAICCRLFIVAQLTFNSVFIFFSALLV